LCISSSTAGRCPTTCPSSCRRKSSTSFRFVEPTVLDDYLPAIISTRVAAAIRGRDAGTTAYLPWIEP